MGMLDEYLWRDYVDYEFMKGEVEYAINHASNMNEVIQILKNSELKYKDILAILNTIGVTEEEYLDW